MFPSHYRMTVAQFRANPHPVRRYSLPFASIAVKAADTFRLVITTPKRIDKRSSHRHTARRIVVEAIRPFLPEVTGKSEVMITLTKCVKKQDRKPVTAQLKQVFEKAGLIMRYNNNYVIPVKTGIQESGVDSGSSPE